MTLIRLPSYFIFSVIMMLSLTNVWSQERMKSGETYESIMEKVDKFANANLVAEALDHLNRAKLMATSSDQLMRIIVAKSELLRSTEDFQQALETLWSANNSLITKSNMLWRIRLLGRLAAVHQEYGEFAKEGGADSVIIYIDSALKLANTEPTRFQLEIASLQNEIGLYVFRKGKTNEARLHYQKACRIFDSLQEIKQLITPLSNLLELESCSYNYVQMEILSQKLKGLIKGKDWYALNMIAYNSLRIASSIRGDSVQALRYELAFNQNAYSYAVKANSDKMLIMREIYEHDKLEQKIAAKSLENEKRTVQLSQEKDRQNRLIAYLALALIAGFGIVLLFFRERRIKKRINSFNEELNHSNEELNRANDRYQLLVVESNHRIKNNLQMISAMLDYTKRGVADSDSKVLRSISGKINTVSSLHKFLHAKEHNELISIQSYFNEIVLLYDNITPPEFHVELSTVDLKIQSERIVYFGLILNELLSNTIEHAPENMDRITITISAHHDKFRFVYFDSSVHTGGNDSQSGTGTNLIKSLCRRIGSTNFLFVSEDGRYQFDFEVQH